MKRMLIDAFHPEEKRVVIEENRQILEFDLSTDAKKQIKGNIYLAKITRVEPSLQAAFVEYGGGKQGFLPFAEIHPDYYQIPAADRQRLMEEAEQEEDDLDEAGEAAPSEAVDTPAPQPDAENAAPPTEAVAPEITDAPASPENFDQPAAQDTGTTEEVATETTAPEQVETIPNEEEEMRERPRRGSFTRRYRIQEVIKRGQIVLVQVIKEERGNKGCSLTTFLSLAGRYCVLMPNSPRDGGVSRKIASGDDRRRLKELMSELKLARGMSVIIRTAGMDRTRAEIKRDYDYLVKLWEHIREDTLSSVAPALVYEESDIIKRAIRDQYTSDIEEIYIQGEDAFKRAKEFMKLLLPSHTARIKHYEEPAPLLSAFGVEDQLVSMLEPTVRLRSGGYIVLNPTEALISIDVNSGRSTGERNIEETATKTNLEAAWEIARQLRLRDLAGLIVIDFIDMFESRNRRAVERALKDALRADRARIQLGRISPFGLLELSRQRLRPSLAEATTLPCSHCNGRGHVRSPDSLSLQIVRSVAREASGGQWGSFRINCSETVAVHMLNSKRAALSEVEQRYGVTLSINIDHSLPASHFTIEKNRRPRTDTAPVLRPRTQDESSSEIPDNNMLEAPMELDETMQSDAPAERNAEPREFDSDGRPRRRRGRRGGKRFRERDGNRPPRDDLAPTDAAPSEETAAPAGEEPMRSERPPRGDRPPRGGRGRPRRWREDEAAPAAPSEPVAAALAAPTPGPIIEEFVIPRRTEAPRPKLHEPIPEPQAASGDQPKRKGWWQKIIELE